MDQKPCIFTTHSWEITEPENVYEELSSTVDDPPPYEQISNTEAGSVTVKSSGKPKRRWIFGALCILGSLTTVSFIAVIIILTKGK